jgi:hypothetical protein
LPDIVFNASLLVATLNLKAGCPRIVGSAIGSSNNGQNATNFFGENGRDHLAVLSFDNNVAYSNAQPQDGALQNFRVRNWFLRWPKTQKQLLQYSPVSQGSLLEARLAI